MTQANTIFTTSTALNTEGDVVPEWIQLTPSGPVVEGRDGRIWNVPSPEAIIAVFKRHGMDLPIDFEHATQLRGLKGERADAIGWIKALEARDGALWGRVEWGEAGRDAVQSRGYRYVSPVFKHSKSTKTILKMVSAGLTNLPNLQLAALNHEAANEETAMDKAILEALGLTEGASTEDALNAISNLNDKLETAMNSQGAHDLDQFVPRADYDQALNRIGALEKTQADDLDEAINTALDGALEAGKIAPASRDYHEAMCRTEDGLTKFKSMVAAAPEIAADTGLDNKDPGKASTQLSDEETAACHALGMSEDEFAKAKAE